MRIRVLVVALFLFGICVGEVEASTAFKTFTDNNVTTVQLTGTVHNKKVHRFVAVQVLYGGEINAQLTDAGYQKLKDVAIQNLSTVSANTNFTDSLYYYQQKLTDHLGAFSFDVSLKGAQYGLYIFRLNIEEDPDAQIYQYIYTPETTVKQVLDDMNEATPSALSSIILHDAYKINANVNGFNALSHDGARKTMVNIILSQKSALTGKEFADVNQFLEVYNNALVLTQIIDNDDGDDIRQIYEQNSEMFDISSSVVYSNYQSMTSSVQQFMWSKLALMDKDLLTSDDGMDLFRDAVFLSLIEKSYSWTSLRSVITDNHHWIGLDLSQYKGKNADKIDENLSGKPFATIEKFAVAFADQVSKLSDTNKGKPSVGTGPSGTGGTGGSPSVSASYPTTPANTPEPTQKPEVSVQFEDIEDIPWAKASIINLANAGIVSGKTEKSFAPNDNIKREEFIKLAVLAFGILREGARCSFTDVSRDSWYYTYVASAVRSGIINGLSQDVFGAGQNITRQEMTVIISRLVKSINLKLTTQAKEVEFQDKDLIADYAKEAVRDMQVAGIITGIEGNLFSPTGLATRAQAVVIIDRVYKIINSL